MLVDTVIEDERWANLALADLAERAARAALAQLDLAADHYEIALLACDDVRIAILNADFRGKPQATNVLSWPDVDLSPDDEGAMPTTPDQGAKDDLIMLGDIAISYDTCLAEAQAAGKPIIDHVTHLIVHGTLHLLGYDHIRDGDATVMERTEASILGKLGVADPYTDDSGAEWP